MDMAAAHLFSEAEHYGSPTCSGLSFPAAIFLFRAKGRLTIKYRKGEGDRGQSKTQRKAIGIRAELTFGIP
jgi:hypothetical protein